MTSLYLILYPFLLLPLLVQAEPQTRTITGSEESTPHKQP